MLIISTHLSLTNGDFIIIAIIVYHIVGMFQLLQVIAGKFPQLRFYDTGLHSGCIQEF